MATLKTIRVNYETLNLFDNYSPFEAEVSSPIKPRYVGDALDKVVRDGQFRPMSNTTARFTMDDGSCYTVWQEVDQLGTHEVTVRTTNALGDVQDERACTAMRIRKYLKGFLDND